MMTQNKITTFLTLILIVVCSVQGVSQQKTDSLILNVGQSKIVFLINNHDDLRNMQQYDLNEILDQLSVKLTGDSTLLRADGSTVQDTTVTVSSEKLDEPQPEVISKSERRRRFGTRHAFNIDLGMNNFLNDGAFPDETNEIYAVKPFGSWYVGLSSIYKTHITGPMYVEWGGGVSWYNFKFENTRTRVADTPDGVVFSEAADDPEIEFKKSKLTVVYAHASFVPMFDFGTPKLRDKKLWKDWYKDNHSGRSFRIGIGAYAGYKIDSYTKTVIDNGDKDRDRNHDNFHLENFRYGARLQMGYRGTDVFFNYDLNELFSEGNGPKLNAFSFGIIL